MPTDKRSGHLRLKQSLVLRDALAAELGLDLPKAMSQLYNVEDNIGATRALDEGRYAQALASLYKGDPDRLAGLDEAVRQACGKAKFSPRYAHISPC